ncbi:MAG: ABC transporter ATP-binding protein [bacterium]
MNSKEIAVEVNEVSKSFKLPHDRKMRLKDYFLRPFSKTQYTKFHALKHINFKIKKGEFIGIIGKNGSGKSTLLKILAGVYMPDHGSVRIQGSLVPFLELGVGFNSELTGKENVFLNGTILGMTNKEIKKKYKEIVDFADIEKFMDTQLKHYSSGMQVRLAFSIAMQAQGDVYLMDEVLAVGDVGFQMKCMEEFNKLLKEGKTVILVTHDTDVVDRLADRVIWINEGNMIEGEKHEIVKAYRESFNL